MKINYRLSIENPDSHLVKVSLSGDISQLSSTNFAKKIKLFLPRWSPGSYLIREYARHLRGLRAKQGNGEDLWIEKVAPSVWEIDWERSQLKQAQTQFEVSYVIYCHEFSVRTSWVESEHAFLHLPTLLMGVLGEKLDHPELELRFPPMWSKITTSLKDISPKREIFLYGASNYDELIDTPIEIGCHETDGFMVAKVPHNWATFGVPFENGRNLKDDIKHICQTVQTFWGGSSPFDRYSFITHFVPHAFGGLEHANSTALHFDPAAMAKRLDYVEFLGLACHEYIHAWNIKRLRPLGLGPFDYLNEAPTQMLWLAEGLTSYLDDLLVFRSGLSTLEEYSGALKKALSRYEKTPGRYQQTLAEAGRDAWIVHYRPDENSTNSAISYYLKGKLAFLLLHIDLFQQGLSFQDLMRKWWGLYLKHPEHGVTEEEIFAEIKNFAGADVHERFWKSIYTTEDLFLNTALNLVGVELKHNPSDRPDWGVEWKNSGERLLVRQVRRDGPGLRAGLNPEDELLFLEGRRVFGNDLNELIYWCPIDRPAQLILSRQGRMIEKRLIPESGKTELQALVIKDRVLWDKFLNN